MEYHCSEYGYRKKIRKTLNLKKTGIYTCKNKKRLPEGSLFQFPEGNVET